MKDFGKRLKEERERLLMSQAEFAKACGVGKTAQYMYERGDREPSWSYMDKANEAGADSHYIFTGTKTGSDWAYARAYKKMLYTVEMLLGLEENRFEEISLMIIEEENQLKTTGQASYDPYNRAVMAWLETSTKPDRCIDLDLLARVLAEIETYVAAASVTLTTEKKAKASIMLYRAFKASGAIDKKLIEETINLIRS